MGTEAVQNRLFHEDWRDALTHLVKALGGYETVGAELWPNKTRKAAGNWLFDCLNVDRAAKPDLEDIEGLLRMGRARGIHIGMHFLCDSLNYSRPETKEPKDTIAECERQIDRHVQKLEYLLTQYQSAKELK